MRLSWQGRRSAARDALREQRLDRVIALIERLLYDLARLMAGHQVDLSGYVAPGLGSAISGCMTQFLDTGELLRPDFGPYADVRIDGDLLQPEQPLQVSLSFQQRSTIEGADGRLRTAERRTVRMRLTAGLDRERITTLHVELTAASP